MALGTDIGSWQYEMSLGDSYILFGNDTIIGVSEIEGLDLPDIRSNDAILAGANGSIPGQDRMESRTVTLSLNSIKAEDELTMRSTLHDLAAAFAPSDEEGVFTFKLGEQVPMRIYCRCRRRSIPVRYEQVFNVVRDISLQLHASDPLIYSEELSSGSTDAPSVPSGRAFSGSYNYNFGAPGAGGVINVNNAGTAYAPWTARVIGPCTNPTIIGPEGELTWESTLAAGEFLDFDAHPSQQTVLVGGTSSQFGQLSDLSTWFLLPPGQSNVVLQTGDGNGSIVFNWRSAWISAI